MHQFISCLAPLLLHVLLLLFSFQQIFKHITILFLEGQVIGYLTRKL